MINLQSPQQIIKNTIIIVLCIILGMHIKIFSLIAFLLSALYVWFSEDSLFLLICIMPFANIFKLSAGSISFFTYLILLYAIRSLLKKKSISIVILYFSIFFLCIQLIHRNLDVKSSLKLIGNLIFLEYAFETHDDPTPLFFGYINGIVGASVVGLIDPKVSEYINSISLDFAEKTGLDSVTRYAGLYIDPNYYSTNLIISMCLLILLFHKDKIKTIPFFIYFGTFFYFITLTYSKSAMLMSAIPVIMLCYSNHKKGKYGLQGILLCFLAIGCFYLLQSSFMDVMSVRLENSSGGGLSAMTTGRSDIWKMYLSFIVSRPDVLLCGRGLSADFYGSRAVHNVYIEILYYIGLIGGFLLVTTLYGIEKEKKVDFKKNCLNYCVMFTILIMYLFLCELKDFEAPVHLALAFFALHWNMDTEKKEDVSYLEQEVNAVNREVVL